MNKGQKTTAKNTGFTFKQFHVSHEHCAMKVGTDGILLGAWAPLFLANINKPVRVLDIGTGSGLISLMLAQRCEGLLNCTAIDIDADACKQAQINVSNSPWFNSIEVQHTAMQQFSCHDKFDLIVSNPPYFVHGQTFDSAARQQARHTNTLLHTELIDSALPLLSECGHLALVLPYDAGENVLAYCQNIAELKAHCVAIKTTPQKPAKRMLIDICYCDVAILNDELMIYNESGSYSDEFINLTRAFYLKM